MEGRKKRLIFVPIELLEERYSAQWYKWFLAAFKKEKIKTIVVGDQERKKITEGQFLDIYDTNLYKLKQMEEIIKHIKSGYEGTVFFLDLWFPSVEMLGYIRSNGKKKIRIEGILHAGTWDDNDFITKNGCRDWGKDFEKSILTVVDKIYVATKYHKSLIVSYFGGSFADKIEVVKFPCYTNNRMRLNKKENIVVFPHRLAPEKQPEVFDQISERLKSRGIKADFIKTKEVCSNKKEYYELLSRSKVVFSSALQETFGIAMLEAVNLGCLPVAPNRLSYKETLKNFPLYNSIEQAEELIINYIDNYYIPNQSIYNEDVRNIIKKVRV